MEIRSTVEVKIQKFVITYGAEQLISWLDQFEKIVHSKDYHLYRSLEREACKACGITLADMRMCSNTPCTNSKRIISFIACHQFKLSVPSIANLLGVSDRRVNYYIKDAETWINSPKSNRLFTEAYNLVIETFKTE
jgi:predicted Zn-ribbon and HTH transcriptional regulator